VWLCGEKVILFFLTFNTEGKCPFAIIEALVDENYSNVPGGIAVPIPNHTICMAVFRTAERSQDRNSSA
jgi:hypothetical protein